MTKSILQKKADELRDLVVSQELLRKEQDEFTEDHNRLQEALHANRQELTRINAAQDCVGTQIARVKQAMKELLDAG